MAIFNNQELGIIERLNRRFNFNKQGNQQDQADAAEIARQREALEKAAKLSAIIPDFISAATAGIDGDLLSAEASETPTKEQIAGMSDEELNVTLRLADDMRKAAADAATQELRQCLANMESAEGWDVADDLAEEVSVIIESREHVAEIGRGYYERVSAEIQSRKRAAEIEERKRHYIEEHKEEFIEALLMGDDVRVSEIREQLENPPAISEDEPTSTQAWGGFPPDMVFGAGSGESIDVTATNEAAEHFKRAYDRQQGADGDAGDVARALQ